MHIYISFVGYHLCMIDWLLPYSYISPQGFFINCIVSISLEVVSFSSIWEETFTARVLLHEPFPEDSHKPRRNRRIVHV